MPVAAVDVIDGQPRLLEQVGIRHRHLNRVKFRNAIHFVSESHLFDGGVTKDISVYSFAFDAGVQRNNRPARCKHSDLIPAGINSTGRTPLATAARNCGTSKDRKSTRLNSS